MTDEDSHHACCQHHSGVSVSQTLDELEFERGLWSAAMYGETDRILHLILDGRNVNQLDSSGYSALHYAARNGHKEAAELLLSHSAYPNARTKSGLATPLHRAAYCGHDAIVTSLLRHKADVNIQDADGRTALHKACENSHRKVVESLLKANPRLAKVKDKRDQMAIEYTNDVEIKREINLIVSELC